MLFFIIHFRIFFFYPRLFQVRACVPCVQVATPLHGKMVQRFCVINETLIFKDLCEQVSVRKLRSSSTFDSFSSMKRTTLNLFIETTNVCWVLAKHFSTLFQSLSQGSLPRSCFCLVTQRSSQTNVT